MAIAGRYPLNRSVKGGFNDDKYIEQYKADGSFPKIHKEMALMLKTFANEPEGCLDLGCCTGLLSVQSVALGRSFCVGIEGNKFDYERCVSHDKVTYHNFYLDRTTYNLLEDILRNKDISLVMARRVFPEIGEADTDVIRELSQMFANYGIKKILIQGRAFTPNHSIKLWNVDLEAECFSKHYTITQRWKDVCLLTLKTDL